MSKLYIADKQTLDKVLETVDVILANLMAMNDEPTLKTKVAANYFNTRKNGKVFGVFFPDFKVSQVSGGERKYDAVNMIARPSTDTKAERNDFDEYAIFNGLTVNGHVDTNGEFVVDYFEGEEGFSKTSKDVYILFGTSYCKIDIAAQGETISVTDTEREGYFPMGGAVRTDGTIRPFIPIAKYYASGDQSDVISSMSGKAAYHNNCSYTWLLTKCQSKGKQYCATTMNDRFLLETLFQVVFATRDSQSVMAGCTSYNVQLDIAHKEEGTVHRVLVTKGRGADFLIGSNVSVGTGDSKDRNNANANKIVDRRKITDIQQNVSVDGQTYDAIYIEGDAFTFLTEKDFISTMPWNTGACDNVLGTCGSPHDNKDGKTPYVFFGVEMAIGMYEVMGNAIYEQPSGADVKGKVHVCYDCTKLTATKNENFKQVNYDIPGGANNWKYVSKLGFDKENPCARMAEETGATGSTGYADGQYTNASAGSYEVLVGGYLNYGAFAGLFCRYLNFALSTSSWIISARLSATGMCGVKAAA